jgi:acetyl esterase
MTLHPQAAAFLAVLSAQGVPSPEQVPLTVGRQVTAGLVDVQGEQLDVLTTDILVPGAAGQLPARTYRADTGDAIRPLIIYFHGGGWVSGDLEIVDRPLRRLAWESGAQIVSVAYRTAPETPFPGPVEDAYAAFVGISALAVELDADPERVFVAGDSSGGNLAAVTALMARDRNGPPLAGQILLYPVTAPAEGTTFASYRENADGYLLTAAAMRFYWDHYVADPAEAKNPYASPLLADDLAALPRALVLTAEFDPLRDEGESYAKRLAEAGVEVTSIRIDGTIHAFFWLPGVLDSFHTAVGAITEFVK